MLNGNSLFTFNQDDISIAGFYEDVYNNIWRLNNQDPSARYPRATNGSNINNTQASTLWQRDVSYMRLKSASIGYTIPKFYTAKLNLSDLYIYCNALNLLTFSKFKLFDPEIDDSQGAGYPPSRSISFGINLTF